MNIQSPTQSLDDALLEAQNAIDISDFNRAFTLYTSLLKSDPQQGNVHFQFGKALLMVEEFDAAITHLTQACQLLPQQYEPIFALMDAFEAVNAIDDVNTLANFLLAQFNGVALVLYRVANYYKETGQLVKSEAIARRCLELADEPLLHCYLWLLRLELGQMSNITLAFDALTAILKKADSNNLNSEGGSARSNEENRELKMIANYALGQYFEQKKKPTLAFDCWTIANNIQYQQCDYEVDVLTGLFEAIKTQDQIVQAPANANISFTPVFILGLPRTGSTLLEQCLSQHTDVMSLGEQPILANQIVNYLAHHSEKPYPLFMPHLASIEGQQLCQKAALMYENAIKKRQLSSRFVIDKLPANFQSIGLIKAIFPNAKIIHLSRHFADTALSIFKNHFSANEPYLCNLEQLSIYNQMYKDLMQHWQARFPEQILEISYEAIVSSPEASIARVLDYCGLSHQEQCWGVEHGSASRGKPEKPLVMVKTLSSAQVTEPIHQRAIGRHNQYADLLSEHGLKV